MKRFFQSVLAMLGLGMLGLSMSGIASIALTTMAQEHGQQSQVIQSEALQWGHLNPLRGDKSPRAADLWGDRTKDTATGMLVGFKKGFSSPPHIHNITYRGVVIEGLVHNDDPTAEKMWLPTASYWTQPAGQNHITAAMGDSNLIFLEIDSGPYLVKPEAQQFDNGERPINVHASNGVWLDETQSKLIKGDNIAIAHLWQSRQPDSTAGYLLKLGAGFSGHVRIDANEFRAVVIQGKVAYKSGEYLKTLPLLPGSYFSSTGVFIHDVDAREETIIYVRHDGTLNAVHTD